MTKLSKAIVANGKVIPAGTDISNAGIDMAKVPQVALEAAAPIDLTKVNDVNLNIAYDCKLKKLLKSGVQGKAVKAEAEKLGEPYKPNISHCRGNAKYDLYMADITIDPEEGTWGRYVIAISQKEVKALSAQSRATLRAKKSFSSALNDMPGNDENLEHMVVELMRYAKKHKLERHATAVFNAAAYAVKYRNFEDSFLSYFGVE